MMFIDRIVKWFAGSGRNGHSTILEDLNGGEPTPEETSISEQYASVIAENRQVQNRVASAADRLKHHLTSKISKATECRRDPTSHDVFTASDTSTLSEPTSGA